MNSNQKIATVMAATVLIMCAVVVVCWQPDNSEARANPTTITLAKYTLSHNELTFSYEVDETLTIKGRMWGVDNSYIDLKAWPSWLIKEPDESVAGFASEKSDTIYTYVGEVPEGEWTLTVEYAHLDSEKVMQYDTFEIIVSAHSAGA